MGLIVGCLSLVSGIATAIQSAEISDSEGNELLVLLNSNPEEVHTKDVPLCIVQFLGIRSQNIDTDQPSLQLPRSLDVGVSVVHFDEEDEVTALQKCASVADKILTVLDNYVSEFGMPIDVREINRETAKARSVFFAEIGFSLTIQFDLGTILS